MNGKYPKVLIIYNSRINLADQHGVSIREWFSEWPKDHLAQIYSGGEVGINTFCGYNFRIGEHERRFGRLFLKLKESSLGQSSYPISIHKQSIEHTKPNKLSKFRNRLSRLLISTGLWELIFKPKISEGLKSFIQEFNPQIIYCQGYNLTFSWLPVMIHKRFNLPICFQTGDDWPKYGYEHSALSFISSSLIQRSAKKLISSAIIRLSNGEAMSEEYLRRYKVKFTPIMMCDKYSRFNNSPILRIAEKNKVSIIYTGNLGSMRAPTLLDLCNVAEELQSEGINISITALVTSMPPDAVELLEKSTILSILPAPSHEELISYLKGADILFIPESFDEKQAMSIQLSISTKAHLYMMSERPVLIYGHKNTGIIDYAKRTGWALRVDKQDRKFLKNSLRKIITNNGYAQQMITKGREIAMQNHESTIVCEKFRKLLYETLLKN